MFFNSVTNSVENMKKDVLHALKHLSCLEEKLVFRSLDCGMSYSPPHDKPFTLDRMSTRQTLVISVWILAYIFLKNKCGKSDMSRKTTDS